MLILYYAPASRAERAYQLVEELGALDAVTIREVSITRQNGTGAIDPDNPHPEGKVPVLDHDGEIITESAAIFAYLTDLFPDAGLAPRPGEPGRGTYLSWLAWYAGVLEPVVHFKVLEIDHPGLARTFRDFDALSKRLTDALVKRPYLVGEAYSAADMLIASTFQWMPALAPQTQPVQDWLQRCYDRPSAKRTADRAAAFFAQQAPA